MFENFIYLQNAIDGDLEVRIANACYHVIMAEKRQCPYSALVTWIRRKISFALLNSITTCLRGNQCSKPTLTASTENDAVVSKSLATANNIRTE